MHAELEFVRGGPFDRHPWKGVTPYSLKDNDLRVSPAVLWMCSTVDRVYHLPPEADHLWVCVGSSPPRSSRAIAFRFKYYEDAVQIFDYQRASLPLMLEEWLKEQYTAGARWIWCEYA